MLFDKLEYRWLGLNDQAIYEDFLMEFREESQESYFNNILKTSVKNFQDFCNDLNHKHVGAFYEGKLVFSLSGHFPNSSAWYMYNQYSKLETAGLLAGADVHATTMVALNMLIVHAEEREIFNYYQRRTVKSQRSLERIFSRFHDRKYWARRYTFYHDAYYPPGESRFKQAHQFYPPLIGQGSIVVLYCLNPLERQRILSTKYPEYNKWYPTPDSNGEHTPFERAASTNCASGANMVPPEGFEPS